MIEVGTTTVGEEGLECVPATAPDLAFTMEPAELVSPQMYLMASCTVDEITADNPRVLRLGCADGPDIVDWTMSASGLEMPLADVFGVGESVDLHYFTSTFGPRVTQWAVIRASGEDDPLFVAVSTNGAMPITSGMPATAILGNTSCDEGEGSCGVGHVRRGAIEFTVTDVGSTVVFDHNEGELGPYRMQVSDVIFDEDNCDGISTSWYEFAIARADAVSEE